MQLKDGAPGDEFVLAGPEGSNSVTWREICQNSEINRQMNAVYYLHVHYQNRRN
jgi:hypothetical protein